MTSKHSYRTGLTIHLHDGAEHEFDVVIDFDFVPGSPERGPSYASGGEPADPPEVDITSVRVFDEWNIERAAIAAAIRWFVESDIAIEDCLIETASEDDRAAREEAAERRAEMRREDRFDA